ncbi:hypothetical protein [Halorubrum ruber]|uniref:Uncharacterized protein n=1 Tax=Halorubrum ruber TaxID=2982524 RepID=A0A8T8LMK8_9EURY|nr:hypothetical protein [Halorubrum ruber]QUO48156.1 hypothetical protein J7656_02000 [Halorubrum ruber]
MTDADLDPRLAEALAQLDESTVEGISDLAANDPELLEELLADVGYLPTSNAESDSEEIAENLSPPQRRLSEALTDMGSPRTTDEIIELLQNDHPDVIEEYQSAKHRPWLSTKLNELVDKGAFGRFRDGRTVRYVPSISEAVRHWALHNNRFVEDLERSDARTIADDTGMPTSAIRNAIEEMTNGDEQL